MINLCTIIKKRKQVEGAAKLLSDLHFSGEEHFNRLGF